MSLGFNAYFQMQRFGLRVKRKGNERLTGDSVEGFPGEAVAGLLDGRGPLARPELGGVEEALGGVLPRQPPPLLRAHRVRLLRQRRPQPLAELLLRPA